MNLLKKITLTLFFISIYAFQINAQDLIENTRAGIHPNVVDQHTNVTSISDNIEKYWSIDKATIMDVFQTLEVPASILDQYKSYLSDYVLLDLKPSELEYVYKQQPDDILMIIPVTKEKYIELALRKTDVTSAFSSKCLHYNGVVNETTGSLAAVTFTNEQISVMISDANGNYVLNKTVDFDNSYALYNDRNLNFREGISCEVMDDPFGGVGKTTNIGTGDLQQRVSADRCVSVYFECDYSTFETYNSDVEEVIFKIESTFNQVQLIYLEEGISLEISGIEVFTEPDPEIDELNAVNLLYQKATRLKNLFAGNLVHFVTTKDVGDGGRAYLNGVHSLSSLGGYNEQSPFPDYLRDVYLVAHEIGHNLGSPHTHDCAWGPNKDTALDNCLAPVSFNGNQCGWGPTPVNGGTIMSYCMTNTQIGVNFSNGFGQEPGDVIRLGAENLFCQKRGCTSPEACNYNPFAQVDDGSCIIGYDGYIFDNYSWINDEINTDECAETYVILYNSSGFDYIYINRPDGNFLYLDGYPDWECVESPNVNCRRALNFTASDLVTSSCGCNDDPCEITDCKDPFACNYNPSADCEDNSLCQYEPNCDPCDDTEIFDIYPWLIDVTDVNSCNFEKITVYTIGHHSFIYVVFSNKGVLYNEDGSIWAEDSGNYYFPDYYLSIGYYIESSTKCCPSQQCVNTGTFFFDDCNGESFYFIETVEGDIFDPYLTPEDYNRIFPNDQIDGVVVNFDYAINNSIENNCNIQPIDITCIEIEDIDLVCDSNSGTFFFENCGEEVYYFIETDDGIIFDPYLTQEDYDQIFENDVIEGVEVNFEYCHKTIDTPCNIQPIDITFIELIIPPDDTIFMDYPWLLNYVDPDNCTGVEIGVYDYFGFDYIYISVNGEGKFYYNGVQQCNDEDYPGYTCLEIYQVDNPTQSWSCNGASFKFNSSNSIDIKKEQPQSQQKIDQPYFNVYPNPNKGHFIIDFYDANHQDYNMNVYDVGGKLVYTSKIDSNEPALTFNLSELNKGIYMIEITNEQFRETQKLIIN